MTEPLRILHVIPGLTTGGAEAVLYRLASSSSAAVKHEVICLEERAWYSDKLEAIGIQVHHLEWNRVGMPSAIAALHRLIRSADADVVQAWMYRSNLFAGLSSKLAGKPVVWNIRCSTFHVYPLATRMLAYGGGMLARWVPRHVINCSEASRRLHAGIGYDSAQGTVIPNGYDAEVFRPDEDARTATRASLGVDADTFLIGTLARWHPQKGIPKLLAAVRHLEERGIPVQLHMFGRGLDANNPELKQLIDANHCGGAVRLVGERSDVADVARALDLHVVSSIAGEGFPNAIAETMLSGTPNVATNVGDSADIVGKTGWVVPLGDAAALAASIEEAYRECKDSSDRWKARRTAARERISSSFTLGRMVEAYEKVWREVAKVK